jgi:murein DD-endopeptidase MepM/ murein hydrolase activator NlpD
MKRLLACILLVTFATACNATIPATPPRTEVSQQSSSTVSSPTIDRLTYTITALLPTDTTTSTATTTPLPCNPVKNYCIEEGHFFLDRPIALPGTNTIDRGYPYGSTEGGTRDPHHGVEFYNASGTPVLAAADGLVVIAGNDSYILVGPRLNFYGNVIVLEHHFPGIPLPIYTVYGHLSMVGIQTGQTVRSGDKIGEVGASGEAIGSHLHFEVRLGENNYDANRNPVLWLKPLVGEAGSQLGTLAGRLEDTQGKLVHTTDMNIQYFPDLKGPQSAAWQEETYASELHPVRGDDVWNENFAMSDIPAGNYRLSLMWGGRLYEHWIVVAPGQLTFFIFRIDQ